MAPYRRGRCVSCVSGRIFTRPSWRRTGTSLRRSSLSFRSILSRSIGSMLRVTNATPLDGYRLRVEFNDGVVRDVDCSFLLRGSLGEPLRDPTYFRQVRVDGDLRTIVWPNGLDPAPELLHGNHESRSDAAGGGARRTAA